MTCSQRITTITPICLAEGKAGAVAAAAAAVDSDRVPTAHPCQASIQATVTQATVRAGDSVAGEQVTHRQRERETGVNFTRSSSLHTASK